MTAAGGNVQVYLGAVAASRTNAALILSESERQRAALFRRPADAEAYVAGRDFLRRLLGAALSVAPAAVPLSPSLPGVKPELTGARDLDFSLSRAEGHLVVAIARGGRQVGVDVEAWSGERAARALPALPVAATMTEAETRAFGAVREAERARTFVGVWTRKEAVAKATGQGIAALPLASFSVGLSPLSADASSQPTGELAAVAPPLGVAGNWSLYAVDLVTHGVAVAVAVLGAAPASVAWA